MSSSSIEKTTDVGVIQHLAPYETSQTRWQAFKHSWKRADTTTIDACSDDSGAPDGGANLKKGLKKRQLQMIALGGCVGSGLLVASGLALKNGPGAVLVAWTIVSTFLYCTMQSLAELAAYMPVSGSFAVYAARFIDPSWGFAMGWNYAMFWVVVLPLELVAASLTIDFWQSNINPVAWIAIFYVLIIILNLCGNKGFGEAEFVSAIIKLLGVVGFDILAVILICGGGDEGYIGGKYWHNPGAFTTGFKGVISVLITAVYSLAGTELIGLTGSESKENPREVLPKAIKQVFWRIVIFYLLTLTLIGFLVSGDSPELLGGNGASASPFVIAIRAGGIKVLPSIFNVIVLVALLAIGNSAVYGFSRTMLGLAEQQLAPSIFGYVDNAGRPLVGILTCAIVGLLSFVVASPKQAEVFSWLVALSGLSTLFTWGSICGAFIQFRRTLAFQERTTDELPYVSNTGLWGAWYGLFMNVLVLCFVFWLSLFPIGEKPSAVAFFKNYLATVICIAFYICHKVYTRNWKLLVPISEINIDKGRKFVDLDLLLQEKALEAQRRKELPIHKKIYHFWC